MSRALPRRTWLPAVVLVGATLSIALSQGPVAPTPQGPGAQPPGGEKADPPKAGGTVKRKDAVKPAPPPPPAGPPVKYDEDEQAPPKAKKQIIPDEEGPPPVTVPRGSYYIRLQDLITGSNQSKHPLVKQVMGRFSVAHDRITDASDRVLRVTPIPLHKTEQLPARFGVFLLNDENAPRNVMGMNLTEVKQFDHYEEMVEAEARKLADVGGQPTVYDPVDPKERLSAAERLLVGVLQFHDGARDQNKRRGKGWEPVKTKLTDRLAGVRVKRIQFAAANKDWETVRALGARMAVLYPNNRPLLAEVFGARLLEAESVVLATNSPTELERARLTLDDYRREFDDVKSATRGRLEAALKRKIKQLFDDAERAVKTDSPDARTLVGAVELLEPEYPGLRELQAQMKSGYSILYVAVHQLPERMTPMTARYDSERMAVELLYEGLLEQLPDEAFGVRFRPALAGGMPVPGGLSRDVPLARPVEWGAPVGGLFDASDVAGTLKLLRQHRHTWAADGIEWLDDQARVDDPTRVRIGYTAGHPFPLSLLTFKVMPAKWLASQGKAADDAAFALRPIGTGPYKLASTPKDGGPREVVFVANPTYARRPGRVGQPFVKEIRFVEAKGITNATNDFKTEKLHVLTDVPTQEIDKFKSGGVQVVTAGQNRRVYMLAVNQRKPQLQSPALRRGIAHAIDREQVLNDVYRGSHPEFHKPLAGPFPSTAWATPRPLGAPPPVLFNKDIAQSKFREYAKKFGPVVMAITFPKDDPRAEAACAAMRKMIEAVGEGDDGRIVVKMDPQTPEDLYRKVYEEGGYDLAYVPFDYKDDLYPFALASLLDPTAAERGGRNFLGYLVKSNNPAAEDELLSKTLLETRSYADPARLEPMAHETFKRFNEAMPFVPLWQLDRHMVVRTTVKIGFDGTADATAVRLLPPRLFPAVAGWRME